MTTRRRYAFYAAATITAATLGGCALVAGLFEPKPLHCSNGIQDGKLKEEGVDCGGDCPFCNGAKCVENNECTSQYCGAGKCITPGCAVGSTNEADTCSACHRCGAEAPCASNLDCASGLCADGICKLCNENLPCKTGNCVSDTCVAVICNNGVKDKLEQGVDCGVHCPTACPDGGTGGTGGAGGTGNGGMGGTGTGGTGGTGTGSTTTSGTTTTSSTGPGNCTDQTKNGTETDVDCGGSCDPCMNSRMCEIASDCQSGICDTGSCVAATCGDHAQNQGEMGVDCDGPCDACGKSCFMDADCMSLTCVNLICRPMYCDKMMATADCGLAPGTSCAANTDCWSGTCIGGTLVCL